MTVMGALAASPKRHASVFWRTNSTAASPLPTPKWTVIRSRPNVGFRAIAKGPEMSGMGRIAADCSSRPHFGRSRSDWISPIAAIRRNSDFCCAIFCPEIPSWARRVRLTATRSSTLLDAMVPRRWTSSILGASVRPLGAKNQWQNAIYEVAHSVFAMGDEIQLFLQRQVGNAVCRRPRSDDACISHTLTFDCEIGCWVNFPCYNGEHLQRGLAGSGVSRV